MRICLREEYRKDLSAKKKNRQLFSFYLYAINVWLSLSNFCTDDTIFLFAFYTLDGRLRRINYLIVPAPFQMIDNNENNKNKTKRHDVRTFHINPSIWYSYDIFPPINMICHEKISWLLIDIMDASVNFRISSRHKHVLNNCIYRQICLSYKHQNQICMYQPFAKCESQLIESGKTLPD